MSDDGVVSESEFNEYGEWTGTCEKCGTDHEGFPPGTVGADMRCFRVRAEALDRSLVDQVEALQREIGGRRDRVLRDAGVIPPSDDA